MTLEEAINHCKEKAEGYSECAYEHRQLAEWLEELKRLRIGELVLRTQYSEGYEDGYKQGHIDAYPERNGRWIGNENHDEFMECSVCGHVQFLGIKMNFCPNCGARMTEGAENVQNTSNENAKNA